MAKSLGPRNVQWLSLEFKLHAAQPGAPTGVEGPEVADALDIHPLMPPKWRKQAREGQLKARRPW